jgi:hypothetical protein
MVHRVLVSMAMEVVVGELGLEDRLEFTRYAIRAGLVEP